MWTNLNNEYFRWLYSLVSPNGIFDRGVTYERLLLYLHNTSFRSDIEMDSNRAGDGLDLRDRFAYEYSEIDDAAIYIHGPCSVLEMMIGLAIRCEETIMDDPGKGDRTSQWFWGMVVNLGLGAMTDDNFDLSYVNECVGRFLDRDYEPNGKGGLFTVNNCDDDLRDMEIWQQFCWYLDSIT